MLWSTVALAVARNKTVRHNLTLLRHRYRRRNFSTTGLYGIPHLKSPNGFQSFVDEAIQRYEIQSFVTSSNSKPFLFCSSFFFVFVFRSGELVSYISTKPSASEI